jgi:hypothetical protein
LAGDRVFRRFTLVRQIGRGGMGVVWLARDETLETEVAVKFLSDAVRWDVAALTMLRRETRRSRELTHPHIVRIHDLHEAEGAAAISLEFMPGGSLHQLRGTRSPPVLACTEIAGWLPGLCAALDHAHAQGVVHRDLKPANLLMAADGAVKISDFGIAQPLFETALRVSQWAPSGTLAYMSPQQHFGEPAHTADDVYALGATLYELLTGKPPFHAGNIAAQIERRVPDSVAARRRQLGVDDGPIPPEWEATIAACLAKRVEDRPASAGEVARRISTATKESSSRVRRVLAHRATRFRPRSLRSWLLGGLALGLGLAAWRWLPLVASNQATSDGPIFASDATRALAAWNLDGDGRDASGRGLHLSVARAVPTADRHGRIDRALHFTGHTALQTNDSPLLAWDGAEPFSVAAWVRPEAVTDRAAVLVASPPDRQGAHFWQLGLINGRPHFVNGALQVAEPDVLEGTTALPSGQWSHLAVVQDGREILLFVDGRLSGRKPLELSRRAPAPKTAGLTVGYFDKYAAERFVGGLDALRVWRRALSAAEVASLADPAPAPRFVVSQGTYTDRDDLGAAAIREFGPDARLADWEELRRHRADDIPALADELGLTLAGTDVLVQRAGQRYVDKERHYFITRFDGKKPDYYLAHDELGGMTLALGSWHSIKLRALVTRPFAAPQTRHLMADATGIVTHDFPSSDSPTLVALRWHREFNRGTEPQSSEARLTLRDGRVLQAVCRAKGGEAFTMALGDTSGPNLTREVGASYDVVEFTLVLRRDQLEFRAVSGVGGTPLFREAVALPGITPADVVRGSLAGVAAADLTVEQ